MYEKDGVFYADEKHDPVKFPKVTGIKPLDNYKLWVCFSTGETKECDFAALLQEPAFRPLQDKSVFNNVYIDYGAPVWNNGEIDIAPEWLYENGKAAGREKEQLTMSNEELRIENGELGMRIRNEE